VAALERRRAAGQLSVRRLRTVGALQHRLRAAFPELGDSAWGLTTVALDPRDTIGIEYLLVPAWFAETFVIDHANAESWRAQKDQLLVVDSLRLAVTALQDSVTRLLAATAAIGARPPRRRGRRGGGREGPAVTRACAKGRGLTPGRSATYEAGARVRHGRLQAHIRRVQASIAPMQAVMRIPHPDIGRLQTRIDRVRARIRRPRTGSGVVPGCIPLRMATSAVGNADTGPLKADPRH
jgi:hypothetical protein